MAARYAAVTGRTTTQVGLASGVVFPDALSGGAYAAKVGMPLFLANSQALSPETAGYLAGPRQARAAVPGHLRRPGGGQPDDREAAQGHVITER